MSDFNSLNDRIRNKDTMDKLNDFSSTLNHNIYKFNFTKSVKKVIFFDMYFIAVFDNIIEIQSLLDINEINEFAPKSKLKPLHEIIQQDQISDLLILNEKPKSHLQMVNKKQEDNLTIRTNDLIDKIPQIYLLISFENKNIKKYLISISDKFHEIDKTSNSIMQNPLISQCNKFDKFISQNTSNTTFTYHNVKDLKGVGNVKIPGSIDFLSFIEQDEEIQVLIQNESAIELYATVVKGETSQKMNTKDFKYIASVKYNFNDEYIIVVALTSIFLLSSSTLDIILEINQDDTLHVAYVEKLSMVIHCETNNKINFFNHNEDENLEMDIEKLNTTSKAFNERFTMENLKKQTNKAEKLLSLDFMNQISSFMQLEFNSLLQCSIIDENAELQIFEVMQLIDQFLLKQENNSEISLKPTICEIGSGVEDSQRSDNDNIDNDRNLTESTSKIKDITIAKLKISLNLDSSKKNSKSKMNSTKSKLNNLNSKSKIDTAISKESIIKSENNENTEDSESDVSVRDLLLPDFTPTEHGRKCKCCLCQQMNKKGTGNLDSLNESIQDMIFIKKLVRKYVNDIWIPDNDFEYYRKKVIQEEKVKINNTSFNSIIKKYRFNNTF